MDPIHPKFLAVLRLVPALLVVLLQGGVLLVLLHWQLLQGGLLVAVVAVVALATGLLVSAAASPGLLVAVLPDCWWRWRRDCCWRRPRWWRRHEPRQAVAAQAVPARRSDRK